MDEPDRNGIRLGHDEHGGYFDVPWATAPASPARPGWVTLTRQRDGRWLVEHGPRRQPDTDNRDDD